MKPHTRLHIPLALFAALFAAWGAAGVAPACGSSVDEAKVAKVKSAYLVNFLRFTQWPNQRAAGDKDPLVITVVGNDTLGRALDATVREVRVQDRPITVQRLDWPTASSFRRSADFDRERDRVAASLRESHLLLLTPSVQEHAAELLERLGDAAVLTVGDGYAFMRSGTMLAMDLEKDRIIFHANAPRIRQAPISVSSRLLTLAKLYEP